MSKPDLSDEQREFANIVTRFVNEAIQIEWSLDSADRFVDALTEARAEFEPEIVDYGIWLVFVCFMLRRLPTPAEAVAMGIEAKEYGALLRSVPRDLWPAPTPRSQTMH